ncbi:MAG: transglycosylase domain-containing protein, partial [Desulfobulbaceae bacterium]|nr:transglycosylase domain-containing protein [Desulfobulbaceae bacterium]
MPPLFKKTKRPAARQPLKKGRVWVWKWTHIHGIVFLLSLSLLFSLAIGALLFLFVFLDIPAISSFKNYQPPAASRVLDADGEVIARIYRRNRTVVSYATMPSLLPQAFIAAEDARYYQHGG